MGDDSFKCRVNFRKTGLVSLLRTIKNTSPCKIKNKRGGHKIIKLMLTF